MIPVVIDLVAVSPAYDADGYPQAVTPKKTRVYADKKSATRSEYWQAMKSGLQASIVYAVNVAEYDAAADNNHAPEHVEDNGTTYKIVRTYQTQLDIIELTCERVM